MPVIELYSTYEYEHATSGCEFFTRLHFFVYCWLGWPGSVNHHHTANGWSSLAFLFPMRYGNYWDDDAIYRISQSSFSEHPTPHGNGYCSPSPVVRNLCINPLVAADGQGAQPCFSHPAGNWPGFNRILAEIERKKPVEGVGTP